MNTIKMMKICRKCNVEKSLSEYCNNSKKKDGKHYYCKLCSVEVSKQYYKTNKEKIKQYNLLNKEKFKQYQKDWREDKPNYNKQWYQDNKEKYKQINKQYKLDNPHYFKQWFYNRRKNNPLYGLRDAISSSIYSSFKRLCNGNYKKSKRTEEILGCTIEDFIQHLQSQFTEGMTLENHGQGEGKWNIDHIIPISSAKTEEEIYKLNHYTNLQPLWYEDNMKKRDKLI